MMKNFPVDGVCHCGGRLAIDTVERVDEATAGTIAVEEHYECQACGQAYGRVTIETDPADVELFDTDPHFLKGVDSTNGKA
jgi:hypothetical protein